MVVDFQKINCKIKRLVKHEYTSRGELKLNKFLYVNQAVKNLLVASRLVSKGYTMGATQDKMAIKKMALS